MKTKTRNIITAFLFVALYGVLSLFITVAVHKDSTTASAATNRSASCVTQGRMMVGDKVYDAIYPSESFDVIMESSVVSGSGTLANNATINWTWARIRVVSKQVQEHYEFDLIKDGSGIYNKDLSGKGDVTLYEGALSDGEYEIKYHVRYKCNEGTFNRNYHYNFKVDITSPSYSLKAGGANITSGSTTAKDITFSASDKNFQRIYYRSPSSSSYSSTTNSSYTVAATKSNSGKWWFYATDSVGNQSETVSVNLDCDPPTMSCANGLSFGTTSGDAITVTATDALSTAKLYVKFESEEWFSTGSSYTIPVTERNGRYYFYAEDAYGNRSETRWIILSTEEPSGSFIKSETDNSVSFVWNNEYWSATLDGSNYTEGRMISNEGQHVIVLSNNAYKTKNYTFRIEHYYTEVSRAEPTCFENGSVSYECSQCGDKYEQTIYTVGHTYNIVSTPSSCTDSEHISYTCTKCGDHYEIEGNYPSGHSYVITVTKNPTCTEDGKRVSECEKCGDSYETIIPANGHNYSITETKTSNGKTTRIYKCENCGHSYTQELGDQYGEVSNYVEYLFQQYSPYMWWVLLAAAGIWSIAIGVMIAIAYKNEDKEKAKKMLVNYVIGLVVIAIIVVACPYLVRGIAALVT